MEHTNKRLEKVETDMHNIEAHLTNLDSQMGQIAQALSDQHKTGQFLGLPITPPKTVAEPKTSPAEETEAETEKEELETSPLAVHPPEVNTLVKPTEVRVPLPQVLQKKKKDDQFSKFWEIFKKVQINILLIEALQQMPGYVKFLKEVVSKKKKWVQYETVNLTENYCFVGNALYDLGASTNLMPLSLYKKMKIGPLKPTTITLQMADRSVSYPMGIVEDILVRVNEFVFPADFVIMDMEEDGKVPLILGRPFLATGKALIEVDNGELTFRFNGQSVTFSIYEDLKRHDGEPGGSLQHCNVVTTVDECVRRVAFTNSSEDQLDGCSRFSEGDPQFTPSSVSTS
ncbi:uncharacterized protein LOC121749319 [Salvia splendens]|uniref:uncharacterized protein LOC121749319 n=1 Tax=Salvia splendens TaxID=180675 RepID=UPI001C26182D|nr:uncharacterized protein LOC121749319 [Salvia splendens]